MVNRERRGAAGSVDWVGVRDDVVANRENRHLVGWSEARGDPLRRGGSCPAIANGDVQKLPSLAGTCEIVV